jgi:DNA-binding GntR family transcriptional regulator
VLALRAQVRGAAGIVTDGGTRDFDVVAALDIPTFSQGPHPSVLGRRHVPWEVDVAIACGGAAVEPGDVIVGDGDGVIVIPPDLAWEVAREAAVQEAEDAWVAEQVAAGASVDGLFPMNAEWRAPLRGRGSGRGPPMTAESKSQQAYGFIRQRIDDGRYVPGYRLVLGQIAKELDVSVVPVREAIRRLEAEGLVTFERNVGAQVALIKETEYLHTMQTLSIVEGAATALSAPYLTPTQLDRARDVNERMRRTLDDFDPHRFTELNLEFHSVLFEECPNPHILDLVHRGWNRMRMLRDSSFSFVPGRARESVAEHDRIVDLIEAGADRSTSTRRHRRHARRHLTRAPLRGAQHPA